jgi:drug/metabolite transporter (DMT)-like permease
MAALAVAASAICFAASSVIMPHTGWQWNASPAELLELFAIELPALFLLFWLMRHLAASRMTARFLLAPLFTIVVGEAMQHAAPPERAWLGIALLAAGAGWLVFAPAERGDGSELEPLRALSADLSRRPPPG